MKNLPLLLTASSLVLGLGCKQNGGGTAAPDFVPTPAAISFSACPAKDEQGATVQDVFPDVKKVTIANNGKVSGELALALSGPGASLFKLGTGLPTQIDKLSEITFPISFSPVAKGDFRAELSIDDKTDSTPNPTVTLIGTGANLPSQPTIETGPQKTDGTGYLTCTAETPLSDCTLEFPDTLLDQSATLKIKIKNKGCPTLKVTALDIDGASNPGTNDGFTIDSPVQLPSTTSPMLLSTADGTDETIITVRFTATEDGTRASTQSHYAVLTIKSNDPQYGDGFVNPARLTLQANAVKPSIYVTPTNCNFTNGMDTCGNTPRIAHKASFKVNNDGSTPITISSVKFRSSGGATSSDNRFTISHNVAGQTIQPTANATIEVTETDQPILVSDQLEIVADIPGQGAGSGGTVVVSVISGVKPCLSTDPADEVDFGDPMDELTAKRVVIKNGAGCGTLILNSVGVRSGEMFYSLLDPVLAANTSVPAGGMVETTVQYKRPTSGGQQLGELQIVSNDTDFGAPQYKQMILRSNAAFDPGPLAELTACKPSDLINDPNCTMGASNSAAFNLSMIDPDVITLSGAKSTDNNRVNEYRFTLRNPVPNGGMGSLANNGMKITSNKTTLTIAPGAIGTYFIKLEVWDDRGQKSGADATITVNVYQ